MELIKQCCSLELAKKLKELGVKQESHFWWEHVTEMASASGAQKTDYWRIADLSYRDGFISAFTVAELGEMLPTYNPSYRLVRNSTKENVFVTESNSNADIAFTADTEADSRAKMLIYLLENKLLTPPLPKSD